jgi:hypothetical protein
MMKSSTKTLFLLFIGLMSAFTVKSQEHSVAMKWNEVQLNCIRKDRPRPTVQARNLCHASIVMWDAWAAYDDCAQTVLLGNTWGGFSTFFDGVPHPEDVEAAREKAISFAMYRYLYQRYLTLPLSVPNSSGQQAAVAGYINGLMTELGYDPTITSTDYTDGDPAKLGNYIAAQMQLYALQDGSNQQGGSAGYANQYYVPVNTVPLNPNFPGTPTIDPNHWQPLCLAIACDQGTSIEQGNCVPVAVPCNAPALTPEFGHVNPFAMSPEDSIHISRAGHDWPVYHDQGAPPYLDPLSFDGMESFFKYGYVMNIIWHSLHDPSDGAWVDISPNAVGNIQSYPQSNDFAAYQNFYGLYDGADASIGYAINPATGAPYAEQWVPRGDYTRVLSEYWADGPNSETPPGHWFTILNEKVTTHPDFEKRWMGEGEILSDLEWDVRSYLALGGGVLDAAIACWGAKGAYDYGRPIFAIRYMAQRGQCTDPLMPNYHPEGLPLIPGYIEVVEDGDPLAGLNGENIGKIKVYSWSGPPAATSLSGVDWILGEEWWTYQSASFVTPPFPGYMSGHSTYSRTAAEILGSITGDEFFPGGMGEFTIPAITGLIAEIGPSMNISLQWARYIDASDQCSMSRIFGGLHPFQDDIPGRRIGMEIGPEVVEKANSFINAQVPHAADFVTSTEVINDELSGGQFILTVTFTKPMNTSISPVLTYINDNASSTLTFANGMWMNNQTYMVTYNVADVNETLSDVVWKVSGAVGNNGMTMTPALSHVVLIDTENPTVETTVSSMGALFNDADAALGTQTLTIDFNENMSGLIKPVVTFTDANLTGSIEYNQAASSWSDTNTFVASFNVFDNNVSINAVDVQIATGMDAAGNIQIVSAMPNSFDVDTENPMVTASSSSDDLINDADAGSDFVVSITFDEMMDTDSDPIVSFGSDVSSSLTAMTGEWIDMMTFEATYVVADANVEQSDLAVQSVSALDANGNEQVVFNATENLQIDTKNPSAESVASNISLVADANAETGGLVITINFDESMDSSDPTITLSDGTFTFDGGSWSDDNTYVAEFTPADAGEEIENINVTVEEAMDAAGNSISMAYVADGLFDLDTRNPEVVILSASVYNVTTADDEFAVVILFDEEMDQSDAPSISFPNENPTATLTYNSSGSDWLTANSFEASFDVANDVPQLLNIDVTASSATDIAGNVVEDVTIADFFDLNAVVSVADITDEGLRLYPNPVGSGNTLILNWAGVPSQYTLQIFNSVGQRIVAQTSQNNAAGTIIIDTTGLASGMYILSIGTEVAQKQLQFQVTE